MFFHSFALPLQGMKQAMIFAAGLGTRLQPLTSTMPKALVKVDGQPLLYHLLMKLKDAGFERVVVNVHHFAEQIQDYLAINRCFGMDIRISDETQLLLETGGGIRKAQNLFDLSAPILIHNVDILSNADLADFYAKADGNDATLLVSDRKTKRYLLFDEGNRLVGWTNTETGEVKSPHEWVHRNMAAHSTDGQRRLAFSGIHCFSPALFEAMASWPERFSIIDFYLKQCDSAVIKGHAMEGLRLLDVGKPEALEQAEQFLKEC